MKKHKEKEVEEVVVDAVVAGPVKTWTVICRFSISDPDGAHYIAELRQDAETKEVIAVRV
jgi:hypothetical protein